MMMDPRRKRTKVERLRTEPGLLDISHRSAFAKWGGRYLRDKGQWTFDATHKDAVEAYVGSIRRASHAEPTSELVRASVADASTMTEQYVLDIPDGLKDIVEAFWCQTSKVE